SDRRRLRKNAVTCSAAHRSSSRAHKLVVDDRKRKCLPAIPSHRMSNYRYIADLAARRRPSSILDYGCGRGELLQMLLERGLDAHGCDVFYAGADFSGL